MKCRKYPPFYEVEQNGVCVKTPPNLAPETTQDYVLSSILFATFIGGLLFVINAATKPA